MKKAERVRGGTHESEETLRRQLVAAQDAVRRLEEEKLRRDLADAQAELAKLKQRGRPAVAVSNPKSPTEPRWWTTTKKCPHCGKTKLVEPAFGIRHVAGKQYPQPWCNDCRSETNYHKRPRKNRTKNGGPGE